ncbi:nuclear transport factor 2 family protein [Algoriphagus machipongonensis]|uniref:Nuclear transport factor 2 family protein n=1 Tax=Algoriphagus machipongonensis TaxID=388413 RepID=A3I251_9BACT|nr:nuclear transport factor 2 family protein [Algoriphagus machipongonensis]EAZ79455.2 hypothetical protein ALPR1_04413 [Algoriphagus machipongonensis]
MKSKFSGILCLLLLVSTVSFSQSEPEQIKEVINAMFDGMRDKNADQIKAAFSEQAIMQTIVKKPEGTSIASNSVEEFATQIGKIPESTQLDERLTDYIIQVDGDMATAWTPYEFYVNEEFSHCGVNSFQLVKFDGKWKIVYIIDTRRKEACVE